MCLLQCLHAVKKVSMVKQTLSTWAVRADCVSQSWDWSWREVQGEMSTVRVDLDFGWRIEQEEELTRKKVESVATSTINQ